MDLVVFANWLGYAVFVTSFIRTVPQILKIFSSRSVEGISMAMFSLELVAFITYLIFSIRAVRPLSAYLEFSVLTLQGVLIFVMILYCRYGISSFTSIVSLLGLVVFSAALILLPFDIVFAIWKIIIPVSVTKGIPQAYSNYKNGHTGQLSSVYILISLFGTSSRIFTVAVLEDNPIGLACYCFTTTMNVINLFQIWYFRKATAKFLSGEKKKKK